MITDPLGTTLNLTRDGVWEIRYRVDPYFHDKMEGFLRLYARRVNDLAADEPIQPPLCVPEFPPVCNVVAYVTSCSHTILLRLFPCTEEHRSSRTRQGAAVE